MSPSPPPPRGSEASGKTQGLAHPEANATYKRKRRRAYRPPPERLGRPLLPCLRNAVVALWILALVYYFADLMWVRRNEEARNIELREVEIGEAIQSALRRNAPKLAPDAPMPPLIELVSALGEDGQISPSLLDYVTRNPNRFALQWDAQGLRVQPIWLEQVRTKAGDSRR